MRAKRVTLAIIAVVVLVAGAFIALNWGSVETPSAGTDGGDVEPVVIAEVVELSMSDANYSTVVRVGAESIGPDPRFTANTRLVGTVEEVLEHRQHEFHLGVGQVEVEQPQPGDSLHVVLPDGPELSEGGSYIVAVSKLPNDEQAWLADVVLDDVGELLPGHASGIETDLASLTENGPKTLDAVLDFAISRPDLIDADGELIGLASVAVPEHLRSIYPLPPTGDWIPEPFVDDTLGMQLPDLTDDIDVGRFEDHLGATLQPWQIVFLADGREGWVGLRVNEAGFFGPIAVTAEDPFTDFEGLGPPPATIELLVWPAVDNPFDATADVRPVEVPADLSEGLER